MKLILVRHGHPDYVHDCLTPLGHSQAEAAANVLKDTHLNSIWSSSCGRAYETALHTAKMHGMEVTKLDFMREISYAPKLEEDKKSFEQMSDEERHVYWEQEYNAWLQAQKTVAEGIELNEFAPRFARNTVGEHNQRVINGLDEWLYDFGYERQGSYYRVLRNNSDTIALFGHGGSFTSLICHLLNMPFEVGLAAFGINFTAISRFEFREDLPEGTLIQPTLDLFGDARHIENCEITYGV